MAKIAALKYIWVWCISNSTSIRFPDIELSYFKGSVLYSSKELPYIIQKIAKTPLGLSKSFNKLWNLGQTSTSLGLHQSSLNKRRNWVAYWQGKTMIGLVLFWSTTPLLICSDNFLRYFNNLDQEFPSSENVTTTGQARSGGKLFDWMSFLKWTPATSGGYLWIK